MQQRKYTANYEFSKFYYGQAHTWFQVLLAFRLPRAFTETGVKANLMAHSYGVDSADSYPYEHIQGVPVACDRRILANSHATKVFGNKL